MKKLVLSILVITALTAISCSKTYYVDDLVFVDGRFFDSAGNPATGKVQTPEFETRVEDGYFGGDAKFFDDGTLIYKISDVKKGCSLFTFDVDAFAWCIKKGSIRSYDEEKELIYKIKVKNGTSTLTTYEAGQRVSVENMVNNKLNGTAIYYQNGKRSRVVEYVEDYPAHARGYDQTGRILYAMSWDGLLPSEGKCYFINGTEKILTKEELLSFSYTGEINCQ